MTKEQNQAGAPDKTEVITIVLRYNPVNAGVEIQSNSNNRIVTLGLLQLGIAELGRPKESAIKTAAAIPANLSAPGRS